MAAEPSNQGRPKGTSAPVRPGRSAQNALAGNTPAQPQESFLWVTTRDDRHPRDARNPDGNPNSLTLTQLWDGFCSEAVLVNASTRKYTARRGNGFTLDGIRNLMNGNTSPIDHLIIVGHGYGEHRDYNSDPFRPSYYDKGYFILDRNANILDQYPQPPSRDPPSFGTEFSDDTTNFRNTHYIDFCKTIKDKRVKHIHLNTCFTGSGWFFLRQFAIDTQAIIYAYSNYVATRWYDMPHRRRIWRQWVDLNNRWDQETPDQIAFGVFEEPGPPDHDTFSLTGGGARQFKRVSLEVESQASQNNLGTMILPGWQVRAYPLHDQLHQSDAIVEVYSNRPPERELKSKFNGRVTMMTYDPKLEKDLKWMVWATYWV